MARQYILAIDQGTTSSRAVIFDQNMQAIASAQEEFPQYFPASGWVEHDAEEIWSSVIVTIERALKEANLASDDIAAIGITNQRETTVLWDKKTGEVLHRAIVWQDRRTSEDCEALKSKGLETKISDITGLLIDPYFSATKLRWLLENVEGARDRAEAGTLAFGTIDSFLIWRLTDGKTHATDATNAARTMLYDIRQDKWSSEICALLDIPENLLPEVKDCADDFGFCARFDAPILGVAGDQQAASIGQACFEPGMLKSTYGTGCFALLNTGQDAVKSKNRLLTTIAYRLDGQICYALEGSIFVAGAVVQWLRDGLGIIEHASMTQQLAQDADDAQDVVIVPAFTGLGAPYWKPDARGAIFGLTRATGKNELSRAALESVGYQTRDLLEAMFADMGARPKAKLRVDGGMSASEYAMQFLADILDAQVDRPQMLETTVLGAAWLAGFQAGLYPDADDFAKEWALDKSFMPVMDAQTREHKLKNWESAIEAVVGKRVERQARAQGGSART